MAGIRHRICCNGHALSSGPVVIVHAHPYMHTLMHYYIPAKSSIVIDRSSLSPFSDVTAGMNVAYCIVCTVTLHFHSIIGHFSFSVCICIRYGDCKWYSRLFAWIITQTHLNTSPSSSSNFSISISASLTNSLSLSFHNKYDRKIKKKGIDNTANDQNILKKIR